MVAFNPDAWEPEAGLFYSQFQDSQGCNREILSQNNNSITNDNTKLNKYLYHFNYIISLKTQNTHSTIFNFLGMNEFCIHPAFHNDRFQILPKEIKTKSHGPLSIPYIVRFGGTYL